MQFTTKGGVHVPLLNLWLDPTRAQPEAVISHAHSDHVRRHVAADATAATAALVLDRYSRRIAVTQRAYREPFRRGSARITLYPAGHVLGSAQVLVEDGGCRLLYTGDLRLRPGPSAEPAEIPTADILVLDSTFGHPRYVFPPDSSVVGEIVAFCEHSFARAETPVLFSYALGKSQQIIAHLGRAGLRVAAPESVCRVNAIYRAHGSALPECAELNGVPPSGTVIVTPPQSRRTPWMQALGPVRTAMLTGWAVGGGARYRYGTDAAFALSDHCGYDDLLKVVELSGAREVHAVFGGAEQLNRELQRRGLLAGGADRAIQLALPGLL